MAILHLTPTEELDLMRVNLRGPLTTSENVSERVEMFSRSGRFERILGRMGLDPSEVVVVTDRSIHRIGAAELPESLYDLAQQYLPEIVIGLGRLATEEKLETLSDSPEIDFDQPDALGL